MHGERKILIKNTTNADNFELSLLNARVALQYFKLETNVRTRWAWLFDICSKLVTALNPYLHVCFKNTAAFFSVFDAHMMYKSITKDCKIICTALFFQISFFYHHEVQVVVFFLLLQEWPSFAYNKRQTDKRTDESPPMSYALLPLQPNSQSCKAGQ